MKFKVWLNVRLTMFTWFNETVAIDWHNDPVIIAWQLAWLTLWHDFFYDWQAPDPTTIGWHHDPIYRVIIVIQLLLVGFIIWFTWLSWWPSYYWLASWPNLFGSHCDPVSIGWHHDPIYSVIIVTQLYWLASWLSYCWLAEGFRRNGHSGGVYILSNYWCLSRAVCLLKVDVVAQLLLLGMSWKGWTFFFFLSFPIYPLQICSYSGMC